MVPLSTLIQRLSDGLVVPKQRVELVARRMREAAALPTGTSGPHDGWKAHVSPEVAAKLLLAVLSDPKSGVWGKGVSVRVDRGGRRIVHKKQTPEITQ